jgi:hypothetical protein
VIFNDINVEIVFIGIGEKNVSNASISDSWAKNWNVIFITPIIDTVLVVDLFSKSVDKLSRGPPEVVFDLLLIHLGIERHQKTLELYVVIIGNEDISYPAVTIQSVFYVIHIELAQVECA